MKKQPHITEQTKNNLRIAFWSLYAQKPIEKISIKEITELAGYNRGTFYLYYNDVYDLLHQIEEEILGKITDVLNDSLEKNDTFDLSGLLASVIRWLQNPKMTLEEFLDFMVGTIFPKPLTFPVRWEFF